MSIYQPTSKFADSNEAIVAPGAVIQAEGQALVRAQGAQANGVQPSTGTSADKFAGFSIAQTSAAPFRQLYDNKVETYVVPSTGNIVLARTPVTGQVSVMDVTANAVDADAVVTDKTISGLTPGNEVTVTYKFALSAIESVARYGNVQPGGYAGDYVGQIGVVKRGVIYTSEFDAAVNWAAATGVKLAANGQLTNQAGSGVAINALIVAVPGVDSPYLGIEFSAPN